MLPIAPVDPARSLCCPLLGRIYIITALRPGGGDTARPRSLPVHPRSQEWERLYGHGNFDSVADGQTGVRGEYVFTPGNPFLGDPEALAKGKDLFRWIYLIVA